MGIITERVEVNIASKSIRYYEDLGYEIPKRKDKQGRISIARGTKILVEVKDLQIGSNMEINVECDECKEVKNIRYCDYFNFKRENGIWYCQKCATKLFTHKNKMKIYLKDGKNSFAQYILDIYGVNGLEKYWDYEKNKISPWEISKCANNPKVWIKCLEKCYHESYEMTPLNFTNGHRCPYCNSFASHKIHKLDSLGYLYPQILHIWSDKNKKSPYEYAPNSHSKVWWKCADGKHDDYNRRIQDSVRYNFRCPECQFSKGEKRVEEYLKSNSINHISQKEFDGLLGLGNGNLSYDFYLQQYNLLIEYQGEQHEKYIKGFHKSKNDFEKQLEHDKRKREYANNRNIKLLEIWYWDFDNIETILNNKINY